MHVGLQVRRLSPGDAAAYGALRRHAADAVADTLEAQSTGEPVRGTDGLAPRLADYDADGTRVWGAFDGITLAGAAELSREWHRAYGEIGVLWCVYVQPRYRGTPASRLLMDSVIDDCRDGALDQILAACASDNVAGQRFLRRFGFEPMTLLIRDGSIHGRGVRFWYLRRPLR